MNNSPYVLKVNEALEQIDRGENLDSAYNQLGIVYGEAGEYAKSKDCFLLSIKSNPNYLDAYINLGIIYGKMKDYKTSILYLSEVLKKQSANHLAFYNLAYAYQESGLIDEAINYYSLSIKHKPDDAKSYFNRSLLYLLKGEYNKGWEDYFGWGYRSGDLKTRNLKGKSWEGEQLKNKVILIYCDQGYGDTINFIRYIKFLKNYGAYVVVEVQESLYRLFSEIKDIDDLVINPKADDYECDYFTSIFGLAKYFHPDYNKQIIFPYINYQIRERDKWKIYLGSSRNIKIGFVWKGNPIPELNNKRHLLLENYHKLFGIENTEWYSLYPEENNEIIETKQKFNNVYDLTKNIYDFSSTAAFISNLDLIVTIDSVIAHLAGSMNIKTCLLLNFVPDWRWGLDKSTTEIYPSLKIFRQKEIGKWDLVINEIYDYIIRLI